MGKIARSIVFVGIFIFAAACFANAATLDEAKTMAQNAAAFVKANGKDRAAEEFNNPKGQFTKGDLYVVFIAFNGAVLAHGDNPSLTGQNLLDAQDYITNNFFVRVQIQIARTEGGGWTTYNWWNPAATEVQLKKSWVQKVDGMDAYVVCGVFQK